MAACRHRRNVLINAWLGACFCSLGQALTLKAWSHISIAIVALSSTCHSLCQVPACKTLAAELFPCSGRGCQRKAEQVQDLPCASAFVASPSLSLTHLDHLEIFNPLHGVTGKQSRDGKNRLHKCS